MRRLTPNHLFVIGAVLILASLIARIFSYPVVTADYTASLTHWMDALRGNPGLSAFRNPFADYTPLYLYMLKILTFLPGYDLYWIKTLSLVFDIFLAMVVCMIVRETTSDHQGVDRDRLARQGRLFVVFAVVLAVPTILVNSSLWGQSDSIYASFTLLSFYFVLRDKPMPAALSFGLAISLKLQAIFFLPILVGYLLARGKKIYYLFVVPVVYVVTILPAALAGGSFVTLLSIYTSQAGEFSALALSAPSIFSLIGGSGLSSAGQSILGDFGLAASTVTVLAICRTAFLIFRGTGHQSAGADAVGTNAAGAGGVSVRSQSFQEGILMLSVLCVLAVPYFLPHMHDRYFYLADTFSVAYAASYPRRWYVPFVIVISSLFAYAPFLSGEVGLFAKMSSTGLGIFSATLLLLILWLVFMITRRLYHLYHRAGMGEVVQA